MGGYSTLNPKNFQWISGDNTAGYIAQLFYLSDKWRFPIGANPNFGLDLSTSLIYTGPPVPLMLLQKVLRIDPSLQFIGFWLLTVIALQILFGNLLGKTLGLSTFQSKIFALLLVTPFFLYRFQFHFWLTSHFLLIWALWIAIRSIKETRLMTREVLLLLIFAYLINTYLLVMSLIILSYPIVIQIVTYKNISRNLARHIMGMLVTLMFTYFVVDFRAQKATLFESLRMNFTGQYTFNPSNLLAMINPEVGTARDCTKGHCVFGDKPPPSYIVENFSLLNFDLGGVQGDHDGFLYLGLGIIFLLSLSIALELKTRGWWNTRNLFSQHRVLLAYVVCVTLFSVTWKVSFGNNQLNIGDPKIIRWALSIFRASGRFMWIIAYLLLALCVVILLRRLKTELVTVFLVLTVLIQGLDMGKPLYTRFQNLRETELISIPLDPSSSSEFKRLALGKSALAYYPSAGMQGWPMIPYLAWDSGLTSGMLATSRINYAQARRTTQDLKGKICAGTLPDSWIVVVPKSDYPVIESCVRKHLSKYLVVSFFIPEVALQKKVEVKFIISRPSN
jgi:hypothetical protein